MGIGARAPQPILLAVELSHKPAGFNFPKDCRIDKVAGIERLRLGTGFCELVDDGLDTFGTGIGKAGD